MDTKVIRSTNRLDAIESARHTVIAHQNLLVLDTSALTLVRALAEFMPFAMLKIMFQPVPVLKAILAIRSLHAEKFHLFHHNVTQILVSHHLADQILSAAT